MATDGKVLGVTVTVGQLTVRARFELPVHDEALLSVTVTVKLYVPAAVGVPESVPADESERPVGKPEPTEKVYGLVPPLAAMV
jgi:hypothetical protein